MVVVDAIARRIPGVLGKTESLEELRVSSPEVYTRPESFMFGKKKIFRFPKCSSRGIIKDRCVARSKREIGWFLCASGYPP